MAVLNKLAKLKSKKFIIIIALIAIFIGAALFVYNKYVAPKLNPKFVENREFTNSRPTEGGGASLYFIYATWCPHSKKLLNIGKSLRGNIMESCKNHSEFIEYDGDKQEEEIDEFSKN